MFSILVYAYADPGLNYLQSQSFLLESDWIVFSDSRSMLN